MSATVAQYPAEYHVSRHHLIDDVSSAKKQTTHLMHRFGPIPSYCPESPLNERIALVLDMDECLIHSRFESDVQYRQKEYRPEQLSNYPDTFEIIMNDGEKALVHKRPGLDRFLEEISQHFDVYVLTAGLEAYGNPILDALDPHGKLFAGRLFRDACQSRNGMFLKDLAIIRQDLSRVILVDNNPISFLLQPSNGIPVPSFYDDASDRTLDSLTKVLLSLREVKDVRPRLHQLFRLADLLQDHQRMILH